MRKVDIAMLMASGLFSICVWTAAAGNPQPPSGMASVEKALKPALNVPATSRLQSERSGQLRIAAPGASLAPSKPVLPQLDQKSLGLGCAQP